MFRGLHSNCIHCFSTPSMSSFMLSSMACLAISCATRMPTPPPVLFLSVFPIHLYPLMFIFVFSGSLVSVISAIWVWVGCNIDSRLLIFPFIPLTLHVTIVRFLFFLIRFLLLLFLAFVLLLFSSCCSPLVGLFIPIVSTCWSSLLLWLFLLWVPLLFVLGVIVITVFGPKVAVFFFFLGVFYCIGRLWLLYMCLFWV